MATDYELAIRNSQQNHRGAAESEGWSSRWHCQCGASGGGWGMQTNWRRGHRQHLRSVERKFLSQIRNDRKAR